MPVTARLRYLRIAPRKVRLVADLLRGKTAEEAQRVLGFTIKKASLPLLKLLKSALASARNNFHLEEKNLYISKITVDEGPKYKRWRARARGQAGQIQKKTSHITIILDEKVKKDKEARPIKRVKKTSKALPLQLPRDEEKDKEAKVIQQKPKFKPQIESIRPKTEKGFKRIFRRKSF